MARIALVTGGCGFIASNFINQLEGFDIILNIDKMSYCSNIHNITRPECHTIEGDICKVSTVTNIFSMYPISVVFHFAAQSHVDNSFDDPISFTTNNVIGTHVLIETCRKLAPNVEFIHFSTDEVYGENTGTVGFTELTALCPTNPYAASKAASDMIIQSYIKSFNMNIKIIRCNNVYGPNQYPEKLIPKCIKLLKEGHKCTVHGQGTVKRSFIHVKDVCSAVNTIWKRGTSGEIYNISSDYEYSVIEIVKLVINCIYDTDHYEPFIEYISDRPFNDSSYLNDCTKLKSIGWTQSCTHADLLEFIKELGTLYY